MGGRIRRGTVFMLFQYILYVVLNEAPPTWAPFVKRFPDEVGKATAIERAGGASGGARCAMLISFTS
jgi:hypothetical protein